MEDEDGVSAGELTGRRHGGDEIEADAESTKCWDGEREREPERARQRESRDCESLGLEAIACPNGLT